MLERLPQKSLNFVCFWGASGGSIRLFGTCLRENCRAPLAGMADWKSEGKAEALGIDLGEKIMGVVKTLSQDNGMCYIT